MRGRGGGIDEGGAAAVEFALVLLPLLMILLGIVEFGRVYTQKMAMQHAVREGARILAVEYDDPGMTAAILDAKMRATLVDLIPGMDDPTDLDALDVYQVQTCTVGGPAGQTAEITLREDTNLQVPLIDGSTLGTVPMAAKAVMACEG